MASPKTVVLIHGLFMTALSWEKWVEHLSIGEIVDYQRTGQKPRELTSAV